MKRYNDPILRVCNMKIRFAVHAGFVHALDSIDLEMSSGDSLALIGESGSGKSVFGLAIVGLLPKTAEIEGEIWFRERNLRELNEREYRTIRGRDIALILQNPEATFNPALKVGYQAAEASIIHHRHSKSTWKNTAQVLLHKARLPNASRYAKSYPHQLSGGMKERVAIMMGCQLQPELLIADEPTKGLDVEMRRLALDALQTAGADKTMIVITHDLLAAQQVCNTIGVLYAGELIELAPLDEYFQNPQHPYSRALMNALPQRGLHPIPGHTPSLISVPSGCRFHPRCTACLPRCREEHPALRTQTGSRKIRCHLYD